MPWEREAYNLGLELLGLVLRGIGPKIIEGEKKEIFVMEDQLEYEAVIPKQ